MFVYKHVPNEFADAFETGQSIAVGTLTHYRGYQGGERTDRMEGTALNTHDDVIITGVNKKNITLPARALQIDAYAGEDIIFTGNVFANRSEDHLLFCASDRIDHNLIKEGNSVFKIKNYRNFCKVLGKHIFGVSKSCKIGNVRYIKRVANISRESPLFADPFAKPEKFFWEHEVRAAWLLRDNPEISEKKMVCSFLSGIIALHRKSGVMKSGKQLRSLSSEYFRQMIDGT